MFSFRLKVSTWCFNFLSCALSAVVTFHNKENIPKCGICVANHTTPVDVMVLHCDNAYALVHDFFFFFLALSLSLIDELFCVIFFLIIFSRLVNDTGGSWALFSEPWLAHLLTFGLNAPKSRTVKLWLKGKIDCFFEG